MTDEVYAPGRAIQIERKIIEFEDGSMATVEPFTVWSQPVRVSEFAEFVRATGYLTTAERECDRNVYFENEALQAVSPEQRGQYFVACVSYDDATAYSRWRGLRLPTEAEWLAMSVQDERIYLARDAADRRALQDLCRRCHTSGFYIETEWTSTHVGHGMAVVRSLPKYARRSIWRQQIASARAACDTAHYDLVLTFRVAGESLRMHQVQRWVARPVR